MFYLEVLCGIIMKETGVIFIPYKLNAVLCYIQIAALQMGGEESAIKIPGQKHSESKDLGQGSSLPQYCPNVGQYGDASHPIKFTQILLSSLQSS